MKTLYTLLFVATLLTAQSSKAQNYTFAKLTGTYASISGTSVSSSGWDSFSQMDLALPFNFPFYGQSQDSLFLFGGGYAAFQVQDLGWAIQPIGEINYFDADMIDHASLTCNISKETSGSSPNRIFKIQVQNAGFEEDQTGNDFANVQLWLYETTGVLEMRYGSSSVNSSTYAPLSGPTVGLFKDEVPSAFISLSGSASNPTASTSAASLNVNGTPPNGTIYRFAPTGGATSIDQLKSEAAFAVYPNPAKDFINISNNNEPTFYEIYNVLGEKLDQGRTNQSINIQQLTPGMYFLKTDLGTSSFVVN